MNTTRSLAAAVLVATFGLLAACGSSGGDVAASSSTTAPAGATTTTAAGVGGSTVVPPTTTAGATTTPPTTAAPTTATPPTTTPPVTSASKGCTSGTGVPNHADSQTSYDFDGDGKADILWVGVVGNQKTVGVSTAAGGGSSYALSNASPIGPSALAEDADGKAPYEIIASTGRSAELVAFVGCKLQAVKDAKGHPYTFDLGFGDYGTGVGCNTIGGKPHLTGLNVTSQSGTTVKWSRTVINLNGLTASNGVKQTGTFHSPQDDKGIASLHTISCGTRTITKDGVSFEA